MRKKDKILNAVLEGIQSGFKLSKGSSIDDSSNIDFEDSKINNVESLNLGKIKNDFDTFIVNNDWQNVLKYYELYGCQISVHSKAELYDLLEPIIEKLGPTANLNFIDVSNLTDISYMLCPAYYLNTETMEEKTMIDARSFLKYFNGDISKWDVSNIENMSSLLFGTKFNGDISDWNMSNVKNMSHMFNMQFNGDISKWDVSNVRDMSNLFIFSKFDGDISKWDVSNVINMEAMFFDAQFNQDISEWNVSNVQNMVNMFYGANKFNQDISNWNLKSLIKYDDMFYNTIIKPEYKPKMFQHMTNEAFSNFKFNSTQNIDDSSYVDFNDSNIKNSESLNYDKLYKEFENAIQTMDFELVDSYFNLYGFKYVISNLNEFDALYDVLADRENIDWLDISKIAKNNSCQISYITDKDEKIPLDVWTYEKTPKFIEVEYRNKLTSANGNSIMIAIDIFEKHADKSNYNIWSNHTDLCTSHKVYDDNHRLGFDGYEEYLKTVDIDGYENCKKLCKKATLQCILHDIPDFLPAVTNNVSTYGKYESYLPSIGQMLYLADFAKFINIELKKYTGIYLSDAWFWTSTEYTDEYALSINLYAKNYYNRFLIDACKKYHAYLCLPFYKRISNLSEGLNSGFKFSKNSQMIDDSSYVDFNDSKIKTPDSLTAYDLQIAYMKNNELDKAIDCYKYANCKYAPKDKKHLKRIIEVCVEKYGPNVDLNWIDVSELTDLSFLFTNYDYKKPDDEYMSRVFNHVGKFNGDISSWDVSNVTKMQLMFCESQFNGDISGWNVSNVTNMISMFRRSAFNGDISGWDVSNVKEMQYMFADKTYDKDLSKWNVLNAMNMKNMFSCSTINSDLSSWKINKECDVTKIFYKCNIDKNHLPKLPRKHKKVNEDLKSGFKFFNNDKKVDDSSYINFNDSKISTIESMNMHKIEKDFLNFIDNVNNINDISDFYEINNDILQLSNNKIIKSILRKIDEIGLSQTIKIRKISDKKQLIEIIKQSNDNDDLNWLDVSNVTNMSELFANTTFNGDISSWDVSNVTNMHRMFKWSQFNGDISNWDVSSVTDMSSMFNCATFNKDISNWNVSNVKNMARLFRGTKFDKDISKWNVSNVEDMQGMFYCSKFNNDISNWNVSNVKNMAGLFSCAKFNQDISNWNVSNVQIMNYMFHKSLFNGDISNWDVSNVTDMSNMFANSQFNGDISKWNVSNDCNVYEMFTHCIIDKNFMPKLLIKHEKVNEDLKSSFKFSNNDKKVDDSSYIDFNDSKVDNAKSLNIETLYKDFKNAVENSEFEIAEKYYEDYEFIYKVTNREQLLEIYKHIDSIKDAKWINTNGLAKFYGYHISFITNKNEKIPIESWTYDQIPMFIEVKYKDILTSEKGNSIVICLKNLENKTNSTDIWQAEDQVITGCIANDNDCANMLEYKEYLKEIDIYGYENSYDVQNKSYSLASSKEIDIRNYIPAIHYSADQLLNINGQFYEGYLPSAGQMLIFEKAKIYINIELKKIIDYCIPNALYWTSSEYDYKQALAVQNSDPAVTANLKNKSLNCLTFFKAKV